MTSISDNRKSRGRPKTGINPPIGVRLYDDQLQRLDQWIAQEPDNPPRPEAIRRLMERGLKKD
ncbi:hypothetical protein HY78_18705 [Rhizorhabdus wittichii DC-6]|nr:hypothetical protein HY78_18705 [Rhizorhabdus wittichii DC-6]